MYAKFLGTGSDGSKKASNSTDIALESGSFMKSVVDFDGCVPDDGSKLFVSGYVVLV